MAVFKQDTLLKFLTNKSGDMEEIQFKSGEEVTIVQVWDKFYLVKDKNGHYFNVRKENLQS